MSSSSVNESPGGNGWASLVEEVGGRRGGARDVGPAVAVLAAVEDRAERRTVVVGRRLDFVLGIV